MEENSIQNEMTAYQLAMELYNGFYNTLMTAVVNSVKNFNGAIECYETKPHKMSDPTTEQIKAEAYYMGKKDAFREIAERIQKEHDLAGKDLENYLRVVNGTSVDEQYENSVRHQWMDFVYRTLHEKKNSAVDTIFPLDNRLRGRDIYWKVMRMKGKLADLLEYYGLEGFRLGRKFEKDKVRLEDADEFNPDRFEHDCIEAFVPDEYKDL